MTVSMLSLGLSWTLFLPLISSLLARRYCIAGFLEEALKGD